MYNVPFPDVLRLKNVVRSSYGSTQYFPQLYEIAEDFTKLLNKTRKYSDNNQRVLK